MKILLHMCCSNCSLYPVKILRSEKHELSGFWFNPNIHPYEEYTLRLESLIRLSNEWKFAVLYGEEYAPEEYFQMFESLSPPFSKRGQGGIKEWEELLEHYSPDTTPPFPGRCTSCYQLRLEKTAAHARANGFDAFSTTLLISPYQDHEQIVSKGKELSEKYNVLFHIKDYRPHFRDAMARSKELGLYRQKYCGCIFSKIERYGKIKNRGTK